eukprot:764106-Hanusia_phi.AAC.6
MVRQGRGTDGRVVEWARRLQPQGGEEIVFIAYLLLLLLPNLNRLIRIHVNFTKLFDKSPLPPSPLKESLSRRPRRAHLRQIAVQIFLVHGHLLFTSLLGSYRPLSRLSPRHILPPA